MGRVDGAHVLAMLFHGWCKFHYLWWEVPRVVSVRVGYEKIRNVVPDLCIPLWSIKLYFPLLSPKPPVWLAYGPIVFPLYESKYLDIPLIYISWQRCRLRSNQSFGKPSEIPAIIAVCVCLWVGSDRHR